MVRAYQRAVVSGTQLRLVVSAEIVRRVLSLNGIDRLVSIYPCLEAALAAEELATAAPGEADHGTPASDGPEPNIRDDHSALRMLRAGSPYRAGSADLIVSVLWGLVDALPDGTALINDRGTVALVNARLTEMFGYDHGELVGKPVEALIPAYLRAAHRGHRADYARQPRARPMGDGPRLVGLRKDGATVPIEVSLSPVNAAAGNFTLAVVRHPVGPQPPARAASAGQPGRAAAGKWPGCGSN